MNYKIIASTKGNSNLPYITERKMKYFELALNWCNDNNWNSCKVNRTYYNFDFDKLEVSIGNNSNYDYYKIEKC